MPPEDTGKFHEWAWWIINVAADPDKGIPASEAMKAYLADVLELRRADPGDDVISELVHAELDGEQLGDEEIFSFIRLLLPAGAETTYRATGNFLFGLLTNPDQLAALRDDRSLMTQAVEEAIRWESPLLITSRDCDGRLRGGRDRDPRRPPGRGPRRLGQPRREPLGPARRSSTSSGSRSPTPPSASVPTCASACTWPGWRCGSRSVPSSTGCRTSGSTPTADDVHIHGERFRSPTVAARPLRVDRSRGDPRSTRERCMGSGNCAFWAPATFDIGDDNIAFVVDPEGDTEDKIRNAAEGCPTQAIVLS